MNEFLIRKILVKLIKSSANHFGGIFIYESS